MAVAPGCYEKRPIHHDRSYCTPSRYPIVLNLIQLFTGAAVYKWKTAKASSMVHACIHVSCAVSEQLHKDVTGVQDVTVLSTTAVHLDTPKRN